MKGFAFKPTEATVRPMFAEFASKLQIPSRRWSVVFVLVLLVIATAATAKAQQRTAYNNVPNTFPLNVFGDFYHDNDPSTFPLNVFSQGAEAYNFTELGDGFTLAGGAGHTLDQVTVIMQSWTCTSGNWMSGPGPDQCVTTPGATYAMPVTVNVYSVVSGTSLEGATKQPAPGRLLVTATQTFNMPYRPSSDFTHCPASASVSSGGYYEWYDANGQTCQDGIDFPITFDLSSKGVSLPSQIIVTFSYNTTSYGPNPLGTQPCNSAPEGCFYDALNISGAAGVAAFPGPVFAPSVGSVLDVNGIFTRFPSASSALCGTGTLANTLALDASPGCYTGNHPLTQVTVK
jgi:hypothetical protein